jgi:hypothetical protein
MSARLRPLVTLTIPETVLAGLGDTVRSRSSYSAFGDGAFELEGGGGVEGAVIGRGECVGEEAGDMGLGMLSRPFGIQ